MSKEVVPQCDTKAGHCELLKLADVGILFGSTILSRSHMKRENPAISLA